MPEARQRNRLTVLVSFTECSVPNLERLKALLRTCPGPDRTVLRMVMDDEGVRPMDIGIGVDATRACGVLTQAGWSAAAGEDKRRAHT